MIIVVLCAVPHSMDYSYAQDDCGACGDIFGRGTALQAERLWVNSRCSH